MRTTQDAQAGELRVVRRLEAADTLESLAAENHKLRGIIARNALQRLRGEDELYVTADDIKDSLDVLYAWQASKSPNAAMSDCAGDKLKS